jgi:hypothetical protein
MNAKPLIAIFTLALAACSPSPVRGPTEGEAQKKQVDAATKLYDTCIEDGARNIDVRDEAAGTLANRVVLACKGKRNALMADVIAFHQIGHPKFTIAQSKAVAEASVATIEDELRQQTVLTIFRRQSAGAAGAPPTAAPKKAAS